MEFDISHDLEESKRSLAELRTRIYDELYHPLSNLRRQIADDKDLRSQILIYRSELGLQLDAISDLLSKTNE
jgi:hypothetical protein